MLWVHSPLERCGAHAFGARGGPCGLPPLGFGGGRAASQRYAAARKQRRIKQTLTGFRLALQLVFGPRLPLAVRRAVADATAPRALAAILHFVALLAEAQQLVVGRAAREALVSGELGELLLDLGVATAFLARRSAQNEPSSAQRVVSDCGTVHQRCSFRRLTPADHAAPVGWCFHVHPLVFDELDDVRDIALAVDAKIVLLDFVVAVHHQTRDFLAPVRLRHAAVGIEPKIKPFLFLFVAIHPRHQVGVCT